MPVKTAPEIEKKIEVAAGASISACFCVCQKNDDVTRNVFFV